MPIMSKQLEDDFELCVERVIESRYEDDKIHCCIMDLKSKVLREMTALSNSDYAKCINCGKEFKVETEWCKECSDFGDGCGA